MALTSSDCGCGVQSDGNKTWCDGCYQKANVHRAALLEAAEQAVGCIFLDDWGRAKPQLQKAIAFTKGFPHTATVEVSGKPVCIHCQQPFPVIKVKADGAHPEVECCSATCVQSYLTGLLGP